MSTRRHLARRRRDHHLAYLRQFAVGCDQTGGVDGVLAAIPLTTRVDVTASKRGIAPGWPPAATTNLGPDGVRGDQRCGGRSWRGRQCGQPGGAERRSGGGAGGAGSGTSGGRRSESGGVDDPCRSFGRGRGWSCDGDDAAGRWRGRRYTGDPGQRHAGGWAGHTDDTAGRPTRQQQWRLSAGRELAAWCAGGAAGDAPTRGHSRRSAPTASSRPVTARRTPT